MTKNVPQIIMCIVLDLNKFVGNFYEEKIVKLEVDIIRVLQILKVHVSFLS